MIHSTTLADRERVARETLAVRVHRPPGFTFRAGQYVDLTIRGLPTTDAMGPVRSLTIASPPSADRLEFLVRVRGSDFKRALEELPPGSELVLEGPFDDLRLERAEGRELVLLAGGVGIAPFLSLLREARGRGEHIPATLFYANRRPEDAAYLVELLRLEREVPGLRVVATMTRAAESEAAWAGETARPGLELLRRHLPSLERRAFYMAGGTSFVSSLRRALLAAGVADAHIGVEMYAGY